ncbi:MAG: GGDEF domain-containing protein, partial [Planctomycetes bacterium]|nr:GGDEF domain-containing protein [Planctomycetota bacterium]
LWSASRRYGFAVSCVLADVDHFKTVNDRFGHQAGDRVLQHIAATLKALSRASDVIGRYGGEEFCVLLPYTDLDQACLVAERYRKGVAASGDGSRAVTLSLGVTAAEPETTGLAQLLDQADQALYGSKQAGRDRVTRWVAAARRSSGGMPPGAP